MILDLSGLWDDKKRTATKGYTPEDTEKWETEWWARHMAHNEGEEASDVTRLRSNKAQMDPNAPKEHVPYNVPGEIPEGLTSKSWARDSFHVAEYVMCRTTGYSIPIFRSGFNANRRFNDRDFNTYTSTKIIFDNMNMVPAPNGTPKGPVPRHMDIVPPVERQERPRHLNDRSGYVGQSGGYRGSQRDTRHHLDRYQNQSRQGGHDYEPRSRDQPPNSFAPSRWAEDERRQGKGERKRSRSGSRGRDDHRGRDASRHSGRSDSAYRSNTTNEPRPITPIHKKFKNQLRTNSCTLDGCTNQADQTSLVTFDFDKTDRANGIKTYLSTCTPCVEQSSKFRTFEAHVTWEEAGCRGVKKVPIVNEAYQADVHDVTGPTTPPGPPPEPQFTSRVPF